MEDIESLRRKIRVAFTELAHENPLVTEMDPLNEIFDYMNEGYINMDKIEYVKEIRKDFVLTEKDFLSDKERSVNPFLENKKEYIESLFKQAPGGSIFSLSIPQTTKEEPINVSQVYPLSQALSKQTNDNHKTQSSLFKLSHTNQSGGYTGIFPKSPNKESKSEELFNNSISKLPSIPNPLKSLQGSPSNDINFQQLIFNNIQEEFIYPPETPHSEKYYYDEYDNWN